MALTILEKRFKNFRLRYPADMVGKTIKSVKELGDRISIVMETGDFIIIQAERGYDDEPTLFFDAYLDIWGYYSAGLITDQEYEEALERQKINHQNSLEHRDKLEYERLKKKYGGK